MHLTRFKYHPSSLPTCHFVEYRQVSQPDCLEKEFSFMNSFVNNAQRRKGILGRYLIERGGWKFLVFHAKEPTGGIDDESNANDDDEEDEDPCTSHCGRRICVRKCLWETIPTSAVDRDDISIYHHLHDVNALQAPWSGGKNIPNSFRFWVRWRRTCCMWWGGTSVPSETPFALSGSKNSSPFPLVHEHSKCSFFWLHGLPKRKEEKKCPSEKIKP
jgi:hypothetical protein